MYLTLWKIFSNWQREKERKKISWFNYSFIFSSDFPHSYYIFISLPEKKFQLLVLSCSWLYYWEKCYQGFYRFYNKTFLFYFTLFYFSRRIVVFALMLCSLYRVYYIIFCSVFLYFYYFIWILFYRVMTYLLHISNTYTRIPFFTYS